jgi:3'(2'), 5'-bisphosphate nucleotidase
MTAPLDALVALALAAGREIMAVRDQGFETLAKLDGSPVTLADHRAEQIIEHGLARLAPDIPMIGEESVAGGRIPEYGERFFCVDPLDGTRGFAEGSLEFTVNIALVENGAPTMGVVYAPATGELYAGEPGRAFKASCDARSAKPRAPLAPIAAQATPPPQWRILASDRSGRDTRTAAFVRALNGAVAHSSSSIKFCRLAEGAADLYPRFGEVSEWDAAAGHAVLSAAGGGVMRLDGSPLRYGAREDGFLVRGFIAFAGAAAASAARGALVLRGDR